MSITTHELKRLQDIIVEYLLYRYDNLLREDDIQFDLVPESSGILMTCTVPVLTPTQLRYLMEGLHSPATRWTQQPAVQEGRVRLVLTGTMNVKPEEVVKFNEDELVLAYDPLNDGLIIDFGGQSTRRVETESGVGLHYDEDGIVRSIDVRGLKEWRRNERQEARRLRQAERGSRNSLA